MRTCPGEGLKRAPAAAVLTKRGAPSGPRGGTPRRDQGSGPWGGTLGRDPTTGPGVGTRRLSSQKLAPKNSSLCKKHSPAHNLAKSWGFFDLDCDGD